VAIDCEEDWTFRAVLVVIGLRGYVAGAGTQSDSALDTIKFAHGLGPGVAFLVAIAIMLSYELTEERSRQIVRDVAQRLAGVTHAR
jgi:glucuronide carrier protein